MLVVEGAEGSVADFARELAGKNGIEELPPGSSPGAADFLLRADAAGLELRSLHEPGTGPVRVDFAADAIQRRARDALRRQNLVRAVGTGLEVLDATAGLGRDAFLLANAGNRIQLLERSPVVHALLADGLRRATADQELAPIIERMQLHCMDFRHWVQERRFDVVYLDPMFPRPDKRARGKKEIVFLQQIAGPAEEEAEECGLLAGALACARARVVVKRPPREGWMDATEPSFSYRGRVSRFDVYLP